jgi:ribosomal protein S18 acetylase RimI-like enzyme
LLSLRTATDRDLDAVLRLWGAATTVSTVTDTREGLERLLATDPEALVLAELDGVAAGTAIVGWDGWRGSVYRLAVDPAHRRQGIATALVREAEHRLRLRGAKRVAVIVVDDDEPAMAFWSASGLTRQDHRARFVRNL